MSLVLAALAATQAAAPPPGQTPLIVDQGRADRQPVTSPPPAPAPRVTGEQGAPPRIEASGSGEPIRQILFQGVKVPAVVAAAARGFVGLPATRATLGRLAAAMSAAYARSAVALYTVVVPDQDLAGGTLRVIVAEGFIERVDFTGGATPLLRAYAARLAAERPLTRRSLERYLSLMRDVPGETIDARLLRGTRPGGVLLQIAAHRKRAEAAFGYDNQGAGTLGTSELSAGLHLYSSLRDGDRTDLTGLVSPDFHRLRYFAATHATPISGDGITLSFSGGYLVTRPRHSVVDGDARTFGISASYPIIRGYKRNLTGSLGVDGIDSDAAAFGSLFSSDHTRALRGALGYSFVAQKSAFTAGATLSRGLDVLAARGTPDFTDTVFTKLNGRVTYDRQLGKRLFVHLRAAAQYSRDRLAAAERFAVGGADFGRAFDQAVLTGDRGYAGSAELAVRPALPKALAGTEIYGFVDGARVHLVSRLPYAYGASYDLASAGGGVRLAYTKHASIGLEAARAINEPYPGYDEKWRVNLAWRLSLGDH